MAPAEARGSRLSARGFGCFAVAFVLVPILGVSYQAARTHGASMLFYLLAPEWLGDVLGPAPRIFDAIGVDSVDSGGFQVSRISRAPNVTLIHNFISPDTARALLGTDVARSLRSAAETSPPPRLEGRADFQNALMSWVYSFVRTSKGGWCTGADVAPIVARLALRTEALTGLSVRSAERPFLSRYDAGDRFRAHYDLFNVDGSRAFPLGLNARRATLLVYLSDVPDGGETEFMLADGGPLRVRARAGSAIIWENCVVADERCVARDWRSLHQGRSPQGGRSKYILTFWLRQWPFQPGLAADSLGSMCERFHECAHADQACRDVAAKLCQP